VLILRVGPALRLAIEKLILGGSIRRRFPEAAAGEVAGVVNDGRLPRSGGRDAHGAELAELGTGVNGAEIEGGQQPYFSAEIAGRRQGIGQVARQLPLGGDR
jgi:hypothetical protein